MPISKPGGALMRAAAPLALFVAGASPSLAQDDALAGTAHEPVGTGEYSPDAVIVTGQRRGEFRYTSPLAASLFTAEDVQTVAAHHPAELINQAPGAFLHRGSGAEHLTAIRSPVLTGGAGAGSFLYLEDGVPMRAAGFSNVNGLFEGLTDLGGGVEIIRGPGTALYGSNALHGLINILTPNPQAVDDSLTLEGGSFGRLSGRAEWSNESGSAYLGLSARHEDGWRDQAGLDRQAGLLKLEGGQGAWEWSLRLAGVNLNQETAGFIFGPDAYRDRATRQVNNDPEAYRDAYALRASAHIRYQAADGSEWSFIPYARSNEMDFLMHFLPSEALEESGYDSVGLLASWRKPLGDSFTLTLGADYERTKGYLRETQDRPTIFSFVQGVHYDYKVEADVAALYAQSEWRPAEGLIIQAGARFEATDYAYDNLGPSDTVGRFLRLPDRSDDFTTFTPNLAASYRVNDNSLIFARLARGARAPQTAELYRLQPTQEIDQIEPETLDSAELGWRANFANGKGSAELVGFVMRKQNVFFRDADGINVTDGQTDHAGVEFALDYALAETLTASVSGSYAEHVYGFDRIVGNSSEVIRDGDQVDTAPNWLWRGALDWRATERLGAQLSWTHVGEYFTNAANSASYDGHDVFDLRVRFQANDRLEYFGAIRNLTDETYAERADFAFGNDRYFPGEARGFSFGARIRR